MTTFGAFGTLVTCAVLVFILVQSSAAVNFDDCGSIANVTSLQISGCIKQPCVFLKGKSYDIKITAVGVSESFKLPYKVTAKVYLVPVTLLKGDACTELAEGKCPVEKGIEFAYEQKVYVKTKFPSMKSTVKALVADDRGNVLICLSLAVRVK